MISERFLLAVDEILASKTWKSETQFCKHHGINRGNLYQLRQDPSRKIFTADWLTFLVEDYGYSPEWLITGKGRAKKRQVGATNVQQNHKHPVTD